MQAMLQKHIVIFAASSSKRINITLLTKLHLKIYFYAFAYIYSLYYKVIKIFACECIINTFLHIWIKYDYERKERRERETI